MATVHASGDVAPFARSTQPTSTFVPHEAVPNCQCHLCSQNKRSRSNLMSTGIAIQTSTNYFHTSCWFILSHRRPSVYTSQHEPHYLTALQQTKQVCLQFAAVLFSEGLVLMFAVQSTLVFHASLFRHVLFVLCFLYRRISSYSVWVELHLVFVHSKPSGWTELLMVQLAGTANRGKPKKLDNRNYKKYQKDSKSRGKAQWNAKMMSMHGM